MNANSFFISQSVRWLFQIHEKVRCAVASDAGTLPLIGRFCVGSIRIQVYKIRTGNLRTASPAGAKVRLMLQIVLFTVWLNIRYPRLAVPIGPIIDKLLEEEKRAKRSELPISYADLYRIAFGMPFTSKI